jgi:UPF0716 family protein affecting phage T7 exclusion
MFEKLKEKWKVGIWQLLLILITFAVGGSLCGYLGGEALLALDIPQKWVRVPVYILLVTILWPLCVLIISIPLGQFSFFKNYVSKLLKRISGAKR